MHAHAHLQMWDVAMAGPLTGAAVAAGLLVIGLAQTVGADPADAAASASLVSVPTPLFQVGDVAAAVAAKPSVYNRNAHAMVSLEEHASWDTRVCCGVL